MEVEEEVDVKEKMKEEVLKVIKEGVEKVKEEVLTSSAAEGRVMQQV